MFLSKPVQQSTMAGEDNSFVKGLNSFSWKLHQKIQSNGNNVLFSPYSVTSALMLAGVGARGNTGSQILQALGLQNTASDGAHAEFSQLADDLRTVLNAGEGVTLNIANKLFARNDMKVLEDFVTRSEKLYKSGIESMDFGNKPDECRQQINTWVEKQTNDKIKDLLAEGSIGTSTTLVLTNAIYFKGKWDKQFATERTTKADFHVSPSDTVKVDMMRMKQDLLYLKNDEDKFAAVSIPYRENVSSLLIILPNDIDGLTALESNMTPDKLGKIITDVRQGFKSKVDLGLPKFTFTETTDLSRILPELGVTDLFDSSNVDIGGMIDCKGIAFSDVVHKAFIEVNEEGTEAAAATAMISRMMMMPTQEVEFICDRPFLFVLMEEKSGLIMFLGRCSKP
ncbi:Serpin B6 [Mactra antiquata]